MSTLSARLRGLGLLLMWLVCSSAPARAKEGAASLEVDPAAPAELSKEQCVDANGKAQQQRREGKLAAARDWLQACANPACPSLVRDDCTRRMDELERAQPTIAFAVQDATGTDLSDVVVSMDGKILTTLLDGTAMPVDIGQHTFEFRVKGQAPVTRTLIVIEGEKLRRERIALSAPRTAPVQSVVQGDASTSTNDRPAGAGLGMQKLSGVVAGGVGVALLIGGTTFGLIASARWSSAEKQCPTHLECSAKAVHDRDTAADYATVSTVGLIAGGVLVAAGVTLFLTAPKLPRANVAVALAPLGLRMRGSF